MTEEEEEMAIQRLRQLREGEGAAAAVVVRVIDRYYITYYSVHERFGVLRYGLGGPRHGAEQYTWRRRNQGVVCLLELIELIDSR